jgi:hypothetical protein
VTVYGNRDFAPTDPVNPLPQASTVAEPAAPPPPAPALPRSLDTRRVVITVNGGEEIELGRAEGRADAVLIARDAIRTIACAEEAGEWPEVGDRFLRPEAIVSIDVQRAEHPAR